jgi:hypothetical protein
VTGKLIFLGGGGWTACSELLEGVEVHEVEATTSIHEGFSEPGRIDEQIDYEGKPLQLQDTIRLIYRIKSDQGLVPSNVLRGS